MIRKQILKETMQVGQHLDIYMSANHWQTDRNLYITMDFPPQCLSGSVEGSVDPVEITIMFEKEAEGTIGLFVCLSFKLLGLFLHAMPQELPYKSKSHVYLFPVSYCHHYLC